MILVAEAKQYSVELAVRTKRVRLSDDTRASKAAVQYVSTPPSDDTETTNAAPTATPMVSLAQDDDELGLETSDDDATVSIKAPSSFSSIIACTPDPARAQLEQILSITLLNLNVLLSNPSTFAFGKICFFEPGCHDRYWSEDQGTWFTYIELTDFLLTTLIRRVVTASNVQAAGCEVPSEQP